MLVRVSFKIKNPTASVATMINVQIQIVVSMFYPIKFNKGGKK
jgi:hypothetical protein